MIGNKILLSAEDKKKTAARPVMKNDYMEGYCNFGETEKFFSAVAGDIHLATDWQLSRDANFSTILKDDRNSKDLLKHYFTITCGSYYVRARHIGSISGASEWAIPVINSCDSHGPFCV